MLILSIVWQFSVIQTDSPSDTLLVQKVWREMGVFSGAKGEVCLLRDTAFFRVYKKSRSRYNVGFRYEDIVSVKRPWYYLAPNRIVLKLVSGKRITLFTYRRKKIIDTIRNCQIGE